MKRAISILVALVLCLSTLFALPAFAATYSGTWGNLSWVLDAEGTLTISGEGEIDDFWYEVEYPWGEDIPFYSYITGYGSKDAWRAHGSKVKNVVIEEGVTSIGDWAFACFTNMKSVSIPKTVTNSKVDPFNGCTALKKVYINDIAAWCDINFYYHSRHGDPNDAMLEVFYSNPFSMGADLYLNGSLVANLVVPEGVTDITNLNGATGINSLTISSTLENLGTFSSIKTLYFPSEEVLCTVGLTNFNNPTIYINGKLFDGSLVVPGSIEHIRDYAFSDWKQLKTVTLEEGIVEIGREAFNGCTSLTDITFPTTISTINLRAFTGCTALQNVHISDIDKWCNVDFRLFSFFGDYAFESGANPLEYAQNLLLNDELITNVVVPDGCYELCAFYGYKKLESISIPANFSIMDYAFNDCDNLYTVYMHGAIQEVGALNIYPTCLLDNAGIVLLSDNVTDIPNDFKSKYPHVSSAIIDDTHYTVYSKYSCGINHVAGSEWYYADGMHYHKCSVCGRGMEKEKHSFDSTVNTCSVCGFTYTKGDVNGDGLIDNLDASPILKYDVSTITLTDAQLFAADVNGDGYADNLDAAMILKYDAGIIDSL